MSRTGGSPVTVHFTDTDGLASPASAANPLPVSATLDSTDMETLLNQIAVSTAALANAVDANSNLKVTARDSDNTNGTDFDNETRVGGGIAHDTADSGNPVKMGGKALSALSGLTLVTANDRVNAALDLDGAIVTREGAAGGDFVSGVNSDAGGASTALIAAGASGIKHAITDFTAINTSATMCYVELKDNTTVKWRFPVPATGGVTHNFKTPLVGSAATAWNTDVSASTATVYCSASGYKTKV